MSQSLLTPSLIAERCVAVELPVPEYDWLRQQRWDGTGPVAGKYSGNSVQTFNSKGQPNDSRSDNND